MVLSSTLVLRESIFILARERDLAAHRSRSDTRIHGTVRGIARKNGFLKRRNRVDERFQVPILLSRKLHLAYFARK